MTASFRAGETVLHSEGQRVHPQQAEHSGRLEQRFYQVGEHVWCYVGNGLSDRDLRMLYLKLRDRPQHVKFAKKNEILKSRYLGLN